MVLVSSKILNNKFYIMRHSIPDMSYRGSYNEMPGPNLSDEGKELAADSVKKLPEKPTVIISSPFARAKQTAEIVARILGIPVVEDDSLRELESAETRQDVFERVRATADKFKDGEVPLLVTHGAEIASLLDPDSDMGVTLVNRGISMGSIWVVDKDGTVTPVFLPDSTIVF